MLSFAVDGQLGSFPLRRQKRHREQHQGLLIIQRLFCQGMSTTSISTVSDSTYCMLDSTTLRLIDIHLFILFIYFRFQLVHICHTQRRISGKSTRVQLQRRWQDATSRAYWTCSRSCPPKCEWRQNRYQSALPPQQHQPTLGFISRREAG